MRIQVLYTMMQEEIIPGTVCTIIHGLQFFLWKDTDCIMRLLILKICIKL